MNAFSPWAASSLAVLSDSKPEPLFIKEWKEYTVSGLCIQNTFWIVVRGSDKATVLFRAAYTPSDELELLRLDTLDTGFTCSLRSAIGIYTISLNIPNQEPLILRCTTGLKASRDLHIPFWPRDLILSDGTKVNRIQGTLHVTQIGGRSGMQYITLDKPKAGAVLYMQNLSALNPYCEHTRTSLSDVIGGAWPELGFALPATKEKPLPHGLEIVLSDALIVLTPDNPATEAGLARQFLDLLAAAYLELPRPETSYRDWPSIVDKGLKDLQHSHGCWSHAAGHDYLNAYVSDYSTPPELMVQLAVLMPLVDYHQWAKKELPVIASIKAGLEGFYNHKLGTVMRFLPALAQNLNSSEEQLKPNVMDSWYLHHPMLNLSRLAVRGDKQAERLFLDSLPFMMKVARHFKYEWPVFYNMETLEVIKAETKKGKGGEKDVAGLYAHVMLQAWELTAHKKYLEEAKKAAKSLRGKGFDLFYQANNTAFSANAMLRLYKITKDQEYLDLSYICLAGILKNVQLWECNYGFAKSYSTFFGVFPLNDAPYTAAYEEQEVFASLHDYLIHAQGEQILPSVSLLLAEFLRYIVQRAGYYYPPNLPADMLAEKPKMGQVDKNLWIALEDIQDGWEKSGQVGQEVYGAGVAFGIVPRHYYRLKAMPVLIFVDYPTFDFRETAKSVSFKIQGDRRLTCRMCILSQTEEPLPGPVVQAFLDAKEIPITENKQGNRMEFALCGQTEIKITLN